MKFFPTKNVIYQTHLNEEEIINQLVENVESKKTFRQCIFPFSSCKPYRGQIIGQTFKIKRIIGYRNSFQPIITGSFERSDKVLIIKVNIKIRTYVIASFYALFGGIGLGFLIILQKELNHSELNLEIFTPFIIILFVYILARVTYLYECRRSIKDLQIIFNAEIISESTYT